MHSKRYYTHHAKKAYARAMPVVKKGISIFVGISKNAYRATRMKKLY